MNHFTIRIQSPKEVQDRLDPELKDYLATTAIMLGLIWFLSSYEPTLQPYGLFQLWDSTGSILSWLIAGSGIILWGFLIAARTVALGDVDNNENAAKTFRSGVLLSISDAIGSELQYRWTYFFLFAMVLPIADWCLGGFMFTFGYTTFNGGVLHAFVTFIGAPVVNFLTYGLLEPQLMDSNKWFVAGAILWSTRLYRDMHQNPGVFGVLNSWFLGLMFFFIMFTYGLLATIVVHALYHLVIFSTLYLGGLWKCSTVISPQTNLP